MENEYLDSLKHFFFKKKKKKKKKEKRKRDLILVQHQYNNGTTTPHMRVSPSMWSPPSCEGLLYSYYIGIINLTFSKELPTRESKNFDT
jgi:hypothetical protein